jgi:Domain of unknown function (DUF4440)
MRMLACAALCLLAPIAARADDGALLKAKMQTLMDAVAPGDRTPWEAMLDSRFVATDENGEVFTYDQEIAAIAPLPKGSSGTIAVTDWTARFFGDAAVTTEIDDEHEDFHGQKLHALYRATATWIRHAGDWKLVGLQTMALQQDPPSVVLPDATLQSYAGRYRAGPDYTYTIIKNGEKLYGMTNDGKPAEIKAELTDVLFTPSQPRTRKIFERGADGKITGFVSRREERDVVFKRE